MRPLELWANENTVQEGGSRSMSFLHGLAFFGVGMTLGGLPAACDPSNPWGGLTDAPNRACPISEEDPDPCVACIAVNCCNELARCAPTFAPDCDDLVQCAQGLPTKCAQGPKCGPTYDFSTAAVEDCIRGHCQGECVGLDPVEGGFLARLEDGGSL
jgi:hypothetical protein